MKNRLKRELFIQYRCGYIFLTTKFGMDWNRLKSQNIVLIGDVVICVCLISTSSLPYRSQKFSKTSSLWEMPAGLLSLVVIVVLKLTLYLSISRVHIVGHQDFCHTVWCKVSELSHVDHMWQTKVSLEDRETIDWCVFPGQKTDNWSQSFEAHGHIAKLSICMEIRVVDIRSFHLTPQLSVKHWKSVPKS